MLYRRKLLLNLIDRLDSPTTLKIQKLMFLFRFLPSDSPALYEFIPNQYGCYSLTLHSDQKALEHQGLITIQKAESPIESTISINQYNLKMFDISLKASETLNLERIVKQYGNKSNDELIDITYHLKPQYAYRSCLLARFSDDTEFMEKIERTKAKIISSDHCIYTIGYEGLSIDAFLKKLIQNNVSTLVDVRKNAFSMRPEFSKTALKNALQQVDIAYVHEPGVGIETTKRKELLPDNKRGELFEWYERNTLPQCDWFIDIVSGLYKTGSVAFMCYEKKPEDCHRSHLASFCLACNGDFSSIVNL